MTTQISGDTPVSQIQVATVPSMVRLNTANGYGSTSICIRRFMNITSSVGASITYADSAALGASFTINVSGIYSVSYNDQFSAPDFVGLSLNTSAPATSIASTPQAEILAIGENFSANNIGIVAWTGYLAAGSVVRPHNGGQTTGSLTNACQLTITRVA